MLRQLFRQFGRAGLLLAAAIAPAYAHHPMDFATPTTLLDGLLSGLGHPVIGIDHFLYIVGAGVLASRFERGYLMPLLFVLASIVAVGVRYQGAAEGLSELWVAGSLVVLGAFLFAAWKPAGAVVAGLFLVTGALHGVALAEAIVGAERTPFAAYLSGLALIQCAVALAAWWSARWIAAHRPRVPVQRLMGATAGIAGLGFVATAAFA